MSTEKINKKEMDAFFEMLKATVSSGKGDGPSPSVAKSRESYPSPAGIHQGNSEPSADEREEIL